MSPFSSVDPDADLMEASDVMRENNVGCLAVVKSGIVYGLISAREIATRSPEYVDHAIKDIMRWSLPR